MTKFHRLWGYTLIQRENCIFSLFEASENEYWLYVRHTDDDSPYRIGKIINGELDEDFPFDFKFKQGISRPPYFYWTGTCLGKHKREFYQKALTLVKDVGMCYSTSMPVPGNTRLDMIIRVKRLRAKKDKKGKPMSYRSIAKELDEDVKSVFRWDKFDIAKLSTV